MNATFLSAVGFAFIVGKDPMDGGPPWVNALTIALIGLAFLIAGTAMGILSVKSRRSGGVPVASPTAGYLLATGLGLNLVAVWLMWLG